MVSSLQFIVHHFYTDMNRLLTNLSHMKRRARAESYNCHAHSRDLRVLETVSRLCIVAPSGHIKNIHLQLCKHKTVTLKLTLTLT